jgi:hypothetical protein
MEPNNFGLDQLFLFDKKIINIMIAFGVFFLVISPLGHKRRMDSLNCHQNHGEVRFNHHPS